MDDDKFRKLHFRNFWILAAMVALQTAIMGAALGRFW